MRVIFSIWLGVLCLFGPVSVSARTTTHTPALLRHRSWQQAAAWLRTQQQPDGGFGYAGLTAAMAYDIALAGENPAGPAWTVNGHSLLAALEAATPAYVDGHDAGQIARVLLAVAQAGADTHHFAGRDLVALLEATYQPATGLYDRYNNFRNALAMKALVTAGRPLPAEAVAGLLAQQQANGGWGWQVGGSGADVDSTGLIMEAVAGAGVPAEHPALQKAIAFLRREQKADGGWGTMYSAVSNSNSTALALRGLVACGVDPEAASWRKEVAGVEITPVTRLLRFQEADGAYRYSDASAGSRLMATADVMPALSASYPGEVVLLQHVYFPAMLR